MALARFDDLPDHYVRDRARWRRRVQGMHELPAGARLYAGFLAFRRWGRYCAAWERADAARVMRVSERTITRWNRELRDAGVLEVEVEGLPGRQQVFRLLNPQVRKGDTGVSPSRERNYRAGVPGSPGVPGRASRPGTRPPDPGPVNRPLPGRKRITNGRGAA